LFFSSWWDPTAQLCLPDRSSYSRRAQGQSTAEANYFYFIATKPLSLLGFHNKTLQRMARNGQVPGVQIEDLWRFRASALNEWLASKLALTPTRRIPQHFFSTPTNG